MIIVKSISRLRPLIQKYKTKRKTIGFVPTMGALHAGHATLLRKCRQENDIAILSVFVNPKQFGPQEDFAVYPRDFKKDVLLAKKENIDIMFYPSVDEMYPLPFLTCIDVERLSNSLCGKFRPGHFKGVATVVAKLLNMVSPDVLYLGQKDAQQCVVVKQMIKDLDFPVKVKIAPTVRETDGLAMSSRNKYLNSSQRQEAAILYKSLKQAKQLIAAGERDGAKIIQKIRSMIFANSSSRIDYIECLDFETLEHLSLLKGKILIALAVWFGQTRLIDNITIDI